MDQEEKRPEETADETTPDRDLEPDAEPDPDMDPDEGSNVDPDVDVEIVAVEEEEAEPASPPPDVPVVEADRIRSLDVLRGVAILGILLVNMWTFALPFPASLNPKFLGLDQGLDRVAYVIVYMLAYTKTMPIFSMLFGAGIVLFTMRVEARGGKSGRRWFSRQFWLWLIGLLHGYLLWNGDILLPYAVVGLILYRFRRFKVRTLIILAVICVILPKLGMYGLGEGMKYVRDGALEGQEAIAAGEEPTAQQEQFIEIWNENSHSWNPDAEQFAEIQETMQGGYGGILERNAGELVVLHLFLYPLFANWSIGAYMMLGMALFKTGVFQAQRSTRFYAVMLAICYGVGLPIAWASMNYLDANFDDMILLMQGSMSVGELAGASVALGHIALIVLAVKLGWLKWLQAKLAAAGRMAFTNYLTQTIICVTIFYGYGFGLWGELDRASLLGVTVAIWLVQLAWSPWWLARFRYGPAEWLWRSLTYRKRQPMRRAA